MSPALCLTPMTPSTDVEDAGEQAAGDRYVHGTTL